MSVPDVPELVRRRAESLGADGRRWLAALPDVLTELRDRWGLELGSAYEGGTAGLVLDAIDGDGGAVVVKVALTAHPDDDQALARAIRVHQIADGQGCARLIAHDEVLGAMLLERLGPNLHELGLPLSELLDVLAATLRSFWHPMGPDPLLRTGADQAQWLARYITTTWEAVGRPCDRRVVDRAVACCERRASAFDAASAVLVHGDAHGWNTLQGRDGSYKFVDPEGLLSAPEHDLAVPMREYNEPMLAGDTSRLVRKRADRLAAACDADPQAVWEWGYIERVSTGLANAHDFGDPGAFLAVAERSG